MVEDENRKITFVNRAFCDLFSVTLIPEDLIGRDYTNALNHIKRLFADPAAFAEKEHALAANRSVKIAQALELKDGRIYERDYVPIYIETGYSGNLWKYRDTTEKNRIKSELIKSERKYKSVIDTMQLGLLEVNKEDKIITANDSFCKILGYGSIDELIGKPAFETLLDEEQQQIMKAQMAEREKGVSNTYEIKAKKADGSNTWMLISGAPLFDNNDNVIGSVGVHLDISYQKRISLELEEKKTLKGMVEWQDKVMDQLEEKIVERTSEVVKQKEIIEHKNKEITQSINYALRIQQALLPHKEELHEVLNEFFIVYKPKDIISGDFFYFSKGAYGSMGTGQSSTIVWKYDPISDTWTQETKTGYSTCYLAAVDSTGHGVPGGFMSMLGYEKLNDAITKEKLPGEILSALNRSIKTSLRYTTDLSVSDGFDIALCMIDVQSNIVHYAGAHRPIWILRKGSDQIEEIRATKAAIGGWTEDGQVFETHKIQLAKGDTFYLFTDGFADQYGTSNKRLLSHRFRELLIANRDKSLVEQQNLLENYLETWQGNEEQTDDILVIGVRL